MPALVKLVPPKISLGTVAQKMTGCRPMREGKFNISLATTKAKCLVHCYGHGGSGFTTIFGSVKKAIELFEHSKIKGKIRVIGAGCVGLTAAIELSKRGLEVKGITAKEQYDITSWRAAGSFATVSIRTASEEQKNLDEMIADTFQVYKQIAEGNHPYLSAAFLRFLPMFCDEEMKPGLDTLIEKGLLPSPRGVCLDFGNSAYHEAFFQYMTYFIDTTRMMRQLFNETQRRGIPLQIKNLGSFDEIDEEIIFNCSGLGARDLNQDESMTSVRGHLLLLNAGAGAKHMDYLICTKVLQGDQKEYIYLFPKTEIVTSVHTSGIPCQGVLGGSMIPHDDRLSPAESEELDSQEFQKILDRSQRFFGC
jgi:D-amino-acid oxidase